MAASSTRHLAEFLSSTPSASGTVTAVAAFSGTYAIADTGRVTAVCVLSATLEAIKEPTGRFTAVGLFSTVLEGIKDTGRFTSVALFSIAHEALADAGRLTAVGIVSGTYDWNPPLSLTVSIMFRRFRTAKTDTSRLSPTTERKETTVRTFTRAAEDQVETQAGTSVKVELVPNG